MPGSFVFDPENAGYYIRKNVPRELANGDFQDYPLWREFNYAFLNYLDSHYGGTLIVPMTVVDPQYFEEIVGKLRADGVDVRHFALCASRETLLKRLRSRGERAGGWPARQIDRCVTGFANQVFREHLQTDEMSIQEVAETIAERLGIALQPDNRSRLGKLRDRVATQLRHIRF